MRRVMLLLLFLLLLTSCSTSTAPNPAACRWQLTTVQQADTGEIIACAPEAAGAPQEVARLQMRCTIEADGTLLLTDEDSRQTLNGSLQLRQSDPRSLVYALVLGDHTGLASVSYTVFADDQLLPTLLLSIGGYALTFHPVP